MIDDLVRLTPDLASLGWGEDLDAWAADTARDEEITGARPGRIAQVSRGWSLVFTGGDAVLAASASIRSQADVDPATGDFVLLVDQEAAPPAVAPADQEHAGEEDPDQADDGPAPDDELVLAAIAPRRSALARRAAGAGPGGASPAPTVAP